MKLVLFLSSLLFAVGALAASEKDFVAIFQTYADANCQKPFKNSAGVYAASLGNTFKLPAGQSSIAFYSPQSAAIKKGLKARVQVKGKEFIGTTVVKSEAIKCFNSKSFGHGKHGSTPLTGIEFLE